MKDILGNELKIGDIAVCTVNPYEILSVGKVIGFTPKKAIVEAMSQSVLLDYWQICK